MRSFEDFTGLPPGSQVPSEGRVGRCPKCGRSGILQKADDGAVFVHSQSSEVLGDGMRSEPRDCCPL